MSNQLLYIFLLNHRDSSLFLYFLFIPSLLLSNSVMNLIHCANTAFTRVSCLKGKHHFTSISFIKRPLKHFFPHRLLPPNAHGKRHFAKGQAGHFLCPPPRALSGSPCSQPEAVGTQVLFWTQVARENTPLLPKLNQINKNYSQLLFFSVSLPTTETPELAEASVTALKSME